MHACSRQKKHGKGTANACWLLGQGMNEGNAPVVLASATMRTGLYL